MDRLPDVYALTEFRENTAAHLRRLSKSNRPTLLTQKGRAAAVVMSPDAYDRLAEAADLGNSIQKVRRSMRQFGEGKGRPATEVLSELRAKYARRARRKSA